MQTETRIASVAIRTPDSWFVRDAKGEWTPTTRAEARAAARRTRRKGRPIKKG